MVEGASESTVGSDFNSQIEHFFNITDSLQHSYKLIIMLMQGTAREAGKDFIKILKRVSTATEEKGNSVNYRFDIKHMAVVRRKERARARLKLTAATLPQTAVIALVTQYDAYVGRLVKNSIDVVLKHSQLRSGK